MTHNPFDQLAKQYLEEFLAPIGTVERQYEVPGEAKFVDVWFVPSDTSIQQTEDFGLLKQMVQTQCLLEPFRNAPSRTDIRTCLLKLIWLQEDERRKAGQAGHPLKEANLPQLWILAATTTQPVIQAFKGEVVADGLPGLYFLGEGLKTAIVAIDQLPETEETLWIRILGRDATQERAIREVLALPLAHPRRHKILRLLASWKVKIEVGEIEDSTEQGAPMALSEAFLEWERETERRAERSLILRLLARRLGEVSEAERSQIAALSVTQLEALGEALLDFSTLADLQTWLESVRQ